MKIVIDSQKIEVEGKKTILEVARDKEIFIPSLCDHSRLAPFSGCRLCIVEVKGTKGYLPSCGTYVHDGMEVRTKTPRLQRLRRQILELILSEHPNACLICTEKENCDEFKSTIRKVGEVTGCVLCSNNGRCELQNVVEALELKEVTYPSLYHNLDIRRDDPFFDRNYNLCILCGRCVRICQEVRGASILSFIFRGSRTMIGTVLDRDLLGTGCQFCGACVDVCPTGALAERVLKPEGLADETIKTICPLCSLGCELKVELKEGRILSSKPYDRGAVNQGQACVKGRFTVRDVVYSSQRILKPLIRVKGMLEEVSWEDALSFVTEKLKKYKGQEIALISSAQGTNEENFLFQKFAREGIKTKNIDSIARYSPLAKYWEWAQERRISPALNFKITDISKARTIFLIGADVTVSHPIIGLEVLQAVNNGARLIVVNPQEIPLSRYSSSFLQIKPGTDLFFLLTLSKILIEEGQIEDISQIEGFRSFKKSLDEINLSQSFEITGISEEELREISRFFSEEKPAVLLFGLGLTQHPWGRENISALWDLALLSEARVFPLGLESNARGGLEVSRAFKTSGLDFNQIIQAVGKGSIKALYLAGSFPSLGKKKPKFLIIQDSFRNENMELADAVLPATTFAETEGTFTNLEGRIQKLNKLIEPLGEAKPDLWIISQLAQKMGFKGFNYCKPSNILKKIKEEIPSFARASYSLLEKGREVFLHEEKETKDRFIPVEYTLSSLKRKEYPFLMVTDYNLDYYRNLSLSEEIKGLRIIRDSKWIKMSPEDAKELKVKEGERIEVKSGQQKIKGIVKITETLPKGIVAASFLWNEESDFSLSRFFSVFNPDSFPLKILPVKIKRGK